MDTLVKNLDHGAWVGWVLFLILSGLVVGIFNQVGASLVAILQNRSQERLQEGQQEFQERTQLNERENQSLQLLITAHFQHREKSLEDAVNVRGWIWGMSSRLFGSDYDYYGHNDPQPVISSATDALGALDRIAYYHPSRSIRNAARNLRHSIGNHFNSPNDDHTGLGGDPEEKQLDKWLESADKIIELIHTPPTLDEIRRPADETSS